MEERYNYPRVAVAIFAYNETGQILLGKRIGKRAYGQWGTPGGSVELNESIEQATSRELFEETGVTPSTSPTVIGLTSTTCEGVHWITAFVTCQINGTPKNCEPDKCAGWDWYNWDSLPNPIMHSIEAIIQKHGLGCLKAHTSCNTNQCLSTIEQQL